MKLAMISQDFYPAVGGIQTYTRELAKRLASYSESFQLIVPSCSNEHHDYELGFPVLRIPGTSDALPVRCAPHLARIVRGQQIDTLFHVQWQTAALGALLRNFGPLKRLAAAVHGRELILAPLARAPGVQRAYDAVRSGVLRSCDIVLPVSRFSAGLAADQGVAPERITVVPNGVDHTRFGAANGARFRLCHALGSAPVLLTVGRLVPRKGIDTVLSCLPHVVTHVPDLLYVVAGDGPDRERLQELALRHGVAASVRFVGRIPEADLADCYAACDAFVLAARDEPDSVEGFGLVLLEASACARPVITCAAGGTAEAVRHEETGLVLRDHSPQALAQALLRVLLNRDLAARLGRGGLRHATLEASWDRAARRIYDALAG